MIADKLQFVRVAGPSSPAISLAEVKSDLRVLTTYFDDLLTAYINDAIDMLDGPSRLAGRCLGVQTYDVYLRTGYQIFEANIPDGVELVSTELIDGTDFSVTPVTATALFTGIKANIKLPEAPYVALDNPGAPNVKLRVRMGLNPVPPAAKNALKLLVRTAWAGDADKSNERALHRVLGTFAIPVSSF